MLFPTACAYCVIYDVLSAAASIFSGNNAQTQAQASKLIYMYSLCPEIFMHNCVNNEFPWSVHWYAYGLGKISFCDARNFGHKMKELEQWWQKWGRFHHLSTPPKIQTVENIMLYISTYIHMSMCGQTHLGNGGKMVRLVSDQKKNWNRIISQDEINHVF